LDHFGRARSKAGLESQLPYFLNIVATLRILSLRHIYSVLCDSVRIYGCLSGQQSIHSTYTAQLCACVEYRSLDLRAFSGCGSHVFVCVAVVTRLLYMSRQKLRVQRSSDIGFDINLPQTERPANRLLVWRRGREQNHIQCKATP